MIFSHEQECVSLKLIGCFPYSQMLGNHNEANTKFIACHHDGSTAGKTSTLVKELLETEISRIFIKFTKISLVNCSFLANSQMLSNQEESNIKFIAATMEALQVKLLL